MVIPQTIEGASIFSRPRPRDVNEQLLEYAEHGFVIDVDPHARHSASSSAIVSLVLSSLTMTAAVSVAVVAIREPGSWIVPAVAGLASALSIVAMFVAARRLHGLASTTDRVQIKPGAVIPPELVRPGDWIRRAGGWARVEEIGPDRTGSVSVLLSSGDLVHLDTTVTIAGGVFRRTRQPSTTAFDSRIAPR